MAELEALPDVTLTTMKSKREEQAVKIARAIRENWSHGSIQFEDVCHENHKILIDKGYGLDTGCDKYHLIAHIGPIITTISWKPEHFAVERPL